MSRLNRRVGFVLSFVVPAIAAGCGDAPKAADAATDATTDTAADVAGDAHADDDAETETAEPDTSVDATAPSDLTTLETDTAEAIDEVRDTPADAWQAVTLATCDGIGPGTEDCAYRYLWRPSACAGGACSRLLIYWSGGEAGCADANYDPLLEKWANTGFVVACAQPFMTTQETGRYPVVDELERMDHLTRAIRADVATAWDGRYLAIGGVSHGATAPIAAIAKSRAFVNRADTWTGRDGTAMILFDGISDPARLEATVGLSDDPNCVPFHARFAGRYGTRAPLSHSCANNACYCAGGGARWQDDTIVVGQTAGPNWPGSPYQCEDFGTPAQRIDYRIVSCGGGQATLCSATGDLIPDDQQTRLADALTQCSDINVVYADHPGCAHALCGSWDFCGGLRAREWLTTLGW